MRVTFPFALGLWATFHNFGCFAFTGNYTWSTFINGDIAVISTEGSTSGLIEFQPDGTQLWEFEPWGNEEFHFIRDVKTKKYIRFPMITDGATPILTDRGATAIQVYHPSTETTTIMVIQDPLSEYPSDVFYLTAERYDGTSTSPRVLRLREHTREEHGSAFQLCKQPANPR
ncbi:predicted protein [Uncinocarpus reesii 1704]|uniref:Uncharacterized protein n=1 Tax=Uncinocarpus reesii (strain UAMH 1704) TaxID=336963 RepID=C4JF00_UNCRE|nr:uncharacterized protein UREG_00901 [Uncinocarpus reesii 1704]EEP76053.1 predicted protein [Uncinocarpus reesii 1704]